MEKYVLPQNNNSDFKFPASDLPLQQPSLNPQCLSWPTQLFSAASAAGWTAKKRHALQLPFELTARRR